MSNFREMEKHVRWLIAADSYCEGVGCGPVSLYLRETYLRGVDIPVVNYYFERCVPLSMYELVYAGLGFRMEDNEGLRYEAEEVVHCETYLSFGFFVLASDQGGNPLLLDLETGRLLSFNFGFIRDDVLTRYDGESGGFREFALTRENIYAFSNWHGVALPDFFEEARKATERSLIEGLWSVISNEQDLFRDPPGTEIEEVQHLISLGLDLDIRNAAGRNPAEEAEFLGETELAALLKEYIESGQKMRSN